VENRKPIFDITQNDVGQEQDRYAQDNRAYQAGNTNPAWAYQQPQMNDMDSLRAFAANLPFNHNKSWSRDR